MKKIFTLCTAVLFVSTLFADQLCFATLEAIDKNNNKTGIPQTGCTMAWNKLNAEKDFVEIDGHKYYKFNGEDSYVQLILNNGDKFAPEDIVTITVAANQDKTVSLAFGSAEGNKTTEAQVSNTVAGEVTRELVAADIDADGSIKVFRAGNSNLRVCSFTVTRETSTEPILNVDVEQIELHANLKNPTPKAAIRFTGKNLAQGEYPMVVPNLAGLSIEPAAVNVGEDGKLNAEVVATFAPEADVEAGETKIILTIGELSKEVVIAYSASFVKDYEYAKSINIEQLVMDNGKGYDIQTALTEAKIEFANLDQLDSLNSAKDLCNEPYLGLKLKTAGAYVACWLKEGSTIRVKFGHVSEAVIGSINGETEEFTPEFLAEPLEFTAPVDCYMILTTSSAKTVVLKQIMIDEPIATVELPECAGQGLEDVIESAKSAKFIENGQLYILQNGVRYNAQGAVVR